MPEKALPQTNQISTKCSYCVSLLASLLASLLVASCSSSHFSKIYNENALNSGMTYCLPTTKIEVLVTKTGETMSISAKPTYVADRKSRYTLLSNTNPLFGIDHEVEIENSLLKSVGSDDSGEIGEIAKALASAIISPPIAAGSLSSPERETFLGEKQLTIEDPKNKETRPTLEEYKKTLASIPDGTQTLIFDRFGGDLPLPGSGGLIRIGVSITDSLPKDGNSAKVASVKECDREYLFDRKFDGFLSRTLLAEQVNVRVWYVPKSPSAPSVPTINMDAAKPKGDSAVLKLLREQSAKLSERIGKRENEYDKYSQELLNFWSLPSGEDEQDSKLKDEKTDQKGVTDKIDTRDTAYFKELSTRMLELRKHIEELQSENFKIDMQIAELGSPKDTPASKPPQYVGSKNGTLSEHGFIMSMTDDESTLHIPTTRGAMGTTTQAYGFLSGILVKSEVSQPSQVLEVLKIPTDVAKEIVSVPAELFGKINTSRTAEAGIVAQEKAIINNQLELLKAQDSLESYQKLTDEQSDKLDRMRRELEILQLEKDIADLGGVLPPP